MPTGDHALVLCMPTSQTTLVVTDSVTGECAVCHQPIWVAPSTAAAMRMDLHLTIVCNPCGLGMAREARAHDELKVPFALPNAEKFMHIAAGELIREAQRRGVDPLTILEAIIGDE